MRHSSADGVGYLLTVVTFLLFLRGHKLALLTSVLMVCVRNDLMFGAGLLQLYTVVFERDKRIPALLAGVATLAAYKAIVSYSGYFGYATMLLFPWEDYPPYIASHEFHWTVQKQITIWGRGLAVNLVSDKACLVYQAMCMVLAFGMTDLRSRPREALRLLVALTRGLRSRAHSLRSLLDTFLCVSDRP